MVWAASTVIAIGAVGAGAVGAIASSNAAGKASKAQSQAAADANATQMAQYEQTREDQTPWRDSGALALNALNNGLGLNMGAGMNSMYGAPTESRASFDADAYMAANPAVADPAQWASGDAYSHYQQYGKAQGAAFTGTAKYNQQVAAMQNPQAQTTQAGFGDLNRKFTQADFQADPGYQFRMDEGARGMNNSAAARGGVLSGAALKAASKYSQNFASNEYGNSYNRFNTDQTNSFNRLASIAGVGQMANNQVSAAGQNMANNVSQNQLGAGNARASGYVGQANALTGGIGQGVNMYQQNQMMNSLSGYGRQNAAMSAGNPYTTQGSDLNAMNGLGSNVTQL